jgi:predicted ester cyclase
MPILSPREIVSLNARSHGHAEAQAAAEVAADGSAEGLAFVSGQAELTAPGGISLTRMEQRSDYYRMWDDAFSDRLWEENEVIVSGSTVVTESTLTGRHTGVFRLRGLDIPPTGKEIRLPIVSIQDVKRGEIVSTRFYFDRMELLEQMSGTK